MAEEDQKFIVTPRQLTRLFNLASTRTFGLIDHFDKDNIVEIAKSQFPRLEAQVAIHKDMEKTKRLLIVVAAICLIAGASLIVFAPAGKEGVSYVVAAALCILPLGAVGIQEFRIRTIGVNVEAGANAMSKPLG